MKIIVFGSESTGMAVCKKIIESNGGGVMTYSLQTITQRDGEKVLR